VKGVYVLLLRFPEDAVVRVGSLGDVFFRWGYYGYVGSGMGRGASSLHARVSRHLSSSKTVFWHIDYVTTSGFAKIVAVFLALSNVRLEHKVAKALRSVGGVGVKGFGSSDCDEGCGSHMFFLGNNLEEAFSMIMEAFRKVGVEPETITFPEKAW